MLFSTNTLVLDTMLNTTDIMLDVVTIDRLWALDRDTLKI